MSVSILALAYAVIAALVLNFWITTRWSLHFKISVVALLLILYVGTYLGLRDIQGWPTDDKLPTSFRLIWAKIDEPDKNADTAGQIYLWVQELNVAEQIKGKPRAYKLPYHIDLAEEVQQAMEQTEKGELLNGKMTRGMLKPVDEKTKNDQQLNNDDGDSDVSGLTDSRIHLEFTEMPKNPLPPKGV